MSPVGVTEEETSFRRFLLFFGVTLQRLPVDFELAAPCRKFVFFIPSRKTSPLRPLMQSPCEIRSENTSAKSAKVLSPSPKINFTSKPKGYRIASLFSETLQLPHTARTGTLSYMFRHNDMPGPRQKGKKILYFTIKYSYFILSLRKSKKQRHMPLTIQTITLLQKYLDGVIRRADHHADNVNKIVFALIGGVIWKTTDDIEVRSYNNAPANIMHLPVNGEVYTFKFNHETGNIDVQNGATVIKTFNNSSSLDEVRDFFESL